jgi:hypothetical protein
MNEQPYNLVFDGEASFILQTATRGRFTPARPRRHGFSSR